MIIGQDAEMSRAAKRLRKRLGAERVRRDVPLAKLGRWQVGGLADLDIVVHTAGEAADVIRILARSGIPRVIVGSGSNLLFDDEGLRGAVLRLGGALSDMKVQPGGIVEAGAALWVPRFVRGVIAAGLAGATHAIGIPGSLGGLVFMNGGSQRRSISEHLLSVEVVDGGGRVRRLDGERLNFAYRSSALAREDLTLLSGRFRFAPDDRAALRREALAILAARRRKFPRIHANCGSVFVNDPSLHAVTGSPGRAIEEAGLKGVCAGDAEIATEHANFIVNRGNASAADILALIELARRRVLERTGIAMRAEVRHVSPDGVVRAAHEALPITSRAPEWAGATS